MPSRGRLVRVALRATVVATALSVTVAGSLAVGVSAAAEAGAGKGHQAQVLPAVSNATNLAKEPVIHAVKGRPPKRLLVKNLVVGNGAAVTASSTVSVKYVGADYATGKDFTTATWQSGEPTTFPLSGVVPGFAKGLVGMKVGGRREIVIPPSLGYGAQGAGPIKPDETLVFVVDLEGVSS